jgi:hypothetical protein
MPKRVSPIFLSIFSFLAANCLSSAVLAFSRVISSASMLLRSYSSYEITSSSTVPYAGALFLLSLISCWTRLIIYTLSSLSISLNLKYYSSDFTMLVMKSLIDPIICFFFSALSSSIFFCSISCSSASLASFSAYSASCS